jgi:hypothetical protein
MQILTKLRSLIRKLLRKPTLAPPWRPKDDAEYFEWLCSAAVVLMQARILYDAQVQKILNQPQLTAEGATQLAELLAPFHTWLYDRQNDEVVQAMMLCSPQNLLEAREIVAKELRKHYVEKTHA